MPVAGVVLAAVAAVLAVRSGGGAEPEPPPVADPVPQISVRPAPVPARTSPAPEPTYRLVGAEGPARPGLRLLLGGDRPGVLDLGTGRLSALPGLPSRPGDMVEISRSGRTTVALVTNPAAAESEVYLLPDGGPAVDIGPARDALPMRDGTVLIVRCDSARNCVLSSRSETGAPRWQRSVPRAARLVRETPLGVVLSLYDGAAGGGQVVLYDAASGASMRVLGRTYSVLAADDRQVAFLPPGCEFDCAIQVAALDGSGRRSLPPAPGRPGTAVFSPDGRRLAVGFSGLHSHDPSPTVDRDGHVAVADLAAGTWTRVPGLATGSKSTPLPVWTGSRELVVAAGLDYVNRFATWTVGAARLTLLPARVDRTFLQPGMLARLT